MPGPSAAGDAVVVVVVVLAQMLAACGLPPRTDHQETSDVYDATPRAVANDNRTMAGTLHRGVLDVALDVVAARWYPEADDGLFEVVYLFAEPGSAPRVPGPLIRVPSGTRIRATIRNTLAESTLVVDGLHTRPGRPSDAVHVPPGGRRSVEFDAGEPGTYFYWARTTPGDLTALRQLDSQLHGAFIVDPPGPPANDRVFVIGKWHDPADSTTGTPVSRDMLTINGKSWPYTERISPVAGDTLRWRWVNPSADAHPMHLHGFHFDVTSRGSWAADTVFGSDFVRPAVTETLLPGGTMSMRWTATEPGNWLFHCHFADHVAHFLSFASVPDHPDPLSADAVDHSIDGMKGLILGITVQPLEGLERRPEVDGPEARRLRVLARSVADRYEGSEGLAYTVVEGGASAADDSVPLLSHPILLRRDEPVRITVVNRLRAPTGVHWHGMELPSFADGVPGWSGIDDRIAPLVLPGDSFVVAFTPPRTGTFMYHSHSNEAYQITSGLFGALLVLDPGATYDEKHDHTFIVGGNGMDFGQGRVNGRLDPDTVTLTVGVPHRLRLINIFPDWRVWITLKRGDTAVAWRAIASDGADLPPHLAVIQDARVRLGTGEAADFLFSPIEPGDLSLDVVSDIDGWSVHVPLRIVEPQAQPRP